MKYVYILCYLPVCGSISRFNQKNKIKQANEQQNQYKVYIKGFISRNWYVIVGADQRSLKSKCRLSEKAG